MRLWPKLRDWARLWARHDRARATKLDSFTPEQQQDIVSNRFCSGS